MKKLGAALLMAVAISAVGVAGPASAASQDSGSTIKPMHIWPSPF